MISAAKNAVPVASLPTRGAWIEISLKRLKTNMLACRSPHGERGLKFHQVDGHAAYHSRSPHGERGLKSSLTAWKHRKTGSLPTRGAWIEIFYQSKSREARRTSLPTRGAWIEIFSQSKSREARRTSLPTRGAWIEIINLIIQTH